MDETNLPQEPSDDKQWLALSSAFGTYLVLLAVGIEFQVFGTVFSDLYLLISGNVDKIVSVTPSLIMMFPIIMAIVVIKLPCSISAAFLQAVILGKSGRHEVEEGVRASRDDYLFFDFFILVLVEELLARWLFLGVFTGIPFLSGTFGFYLLFFLGNGIWALLHLDNFKDEKDKHILRVLPQFVGGIFLTYIYVKFGLLAVVLAHFASNAILFSTHRTQRINYIDFLITGYATLTAIVSYLLMQRPLSEMAPWFQDSPTFILPNWDIADYLTASVFVCSALMALFGVLLYDRGEAGKKEIGLIGSIFFLPVSIIFIYLAYSVLFFVTPNTPFRVLCVAIWLTFHQKGASGSAMARTFWVNLPEMYIAVCIIQALDLWSCVLLFTLELIIHAPRIILTRYDD